MRTDTTTLIQQLRALADRINDEDVIPIVQAAARLEEVRDKCKALLASIEEVADLDYGASGIIESQEFKAAKEACEQ